MKKGVASFISVSLAIPFPDLAQWLPLYATRLFHFSRVQNCVEEYEGQDGSLPPEEI
jgi:hypothetical protein